MQYEELAAFLKYVGRDPTTLIFEDELTGIHNRRFLLSYLAHKVDWRAKTDYALSLLIIDLDRFKEINDTHGHETGDQVLTWVAALLVKVAGEDGFPVRYGGDEFILLLPKTDRAGARAAADRLLQTIRDRPFRERDSGLVVPMTMSVGIAVAPEDATTAEELIHAADIALYAAKSSGRNQAAVASELDQDQVFPRAVLQRLKLQGIVGRDEELDMVDRVLRGMAKGRSQVLVFEGGPGVGKTTLLDTVRRNLKADGAFFVTKVAGDPHESRRPYYLASRILIDLLNQRGDEGVELLHRLTPRERSYLAHVLPGLVKEEITGEIDRETRQGIFMTFTRLLRQSVEGRPMILLVDDMEFVDEATLLLLSVAAQRGDLEFMLCGSVGESLRLSGETEPSPVERFFTDCPKEIRLRRITLKPLGPPHIAEYLKAVFPNVQMPEGFEDDLVRVTDGNPFFLSEIIRNLLADGKVQLIGQDWVIEPLDPAYLSRSLEDIVTQKIAALDQQDREVLERASTLGEDIPVSILTGSTDLDESSVQAFLDRAENLGLVSLDFQVNDEVMHFLGKRILDISYAAIDDERRQQLHEEVGQYQERLFEQRLLPSASMLAYHFRRSANEAKARQYEQIHKRYRDSVFEPSEVADYTADDEREEIEAGAPLDEEIEAGAPLDEETAAHVPRALRLVLSAVRSAQLYPPESMAVVRAMEQARGSLDPIFSHTERLTLTIAEDTLSANGIPLDLAEYRVLESSFLDLLKGAELRALSLTRDVTGDELGRLLTAMGSCVPGTLAPTHWQTVVRTERLQNVEVRQTRYKRVSQPGGEGPRGAASTDRDALSSAEMELIPELLRVILKTASDYRLYPVGSERVSSSIGDLLGSLTALLVGRSGLSLARVETFILVNGQRADVTQWQSVADGFMEFLDSLSLSSITFLDGLTRSDLEAVFGRLRDAPHDVGVPGFWERFAAEAGLAGIAFNQEAYAAGLVQAQLGAALAGYPPSSGGDRSAAVADVTGPTERPEEHVLDDEVIDLEWDPDEYDGADLDVDESVVRVAKELLLEGRHDEVKELLHRVFAGYAEADAAQRLVRIQTCQGMFEHVVLGLQHKLSEIALEPLAAVTASETGPSVLSELARLLYDMGASAIRFSDYHLAARIYDIVETRRSELRGRGAHADGPYAALVSVELDDHTSQLLMEDLRSGRTDRQARASLAVSHMGVTAMDLLIDVVKQERDLRVRQLAAGLLAELDADAGERLKETVLTEVLLEHRYRVLEVIDIVTQDVRMVLAFNVGDENPKIRRASFHLFERLQQDNLVDLMVPFATGEDAGIAKGAIRSLATVGTPRAVQALIDILVDSDSPERATACCSALAGLKAEGAVEAMGEILSKRKLGFLGYHWDEEARAVAAVGLYQIATPRAVALLSKHKDDPSQRIREMAQPRKAEA